MLITSAGSVPSGLIRPDSPRTARAFRAGSTAAPSTPSRASTAPRTAALFSPMPPVNTSASTRPSATAMPAICFARRYTNASTASRAPA